MHPEDPLIVYAVEGEPVTLVAPVADVEDFHWSRTDGAIDSRWASSSDGARITLTTQSATLADSGEYVLHTSNVPRKRMRLEVRGRTPADTDTTSPFFLRRLTDLAVKVGSRTRLIVEIQSESEVQVTWYRNSRRLQPSAAVNITSEGRFHCLELNAATPEDSGRWTCAAANKTGRSECSAHLNVIVPKAYKRPEFLEELRAILTDQGTVSLECKVVGVPTPTLRWFKDSEEIRAGDVFALTANPEDATSLGIYTCEASNCMGKAYSSSKVHVVGRGSREGSLKPADSIISSEPPPTFVVELEDKQVKVGEPLELSCRVGVPPWPKSVVWYNKIGRANPTECTALEDGVGGLKLMIPSVTWDHEGEWKCVASSAGGRLSVSTCYINVDVPKNYRKPRFMENLKAILTEEGLVSFECKVVGFPTPQLSWFKDGLELKPGDVYQLTGSNSLGSYCCIAKNCMGQASSQAELTVEDIQNQLDDEERMQLFSENKAPKFVQVLKSQEAKINEDFRFSVKVSISPEPTLTWYRDDQPIDESPRYKITKESKGVYHLDIKQLEITDQAEWKCIATNEFGHSVTSCFLKLVIPKHFKKPRFLENLRAILSEEGAVNLECKVIGVPQPILKWYKDGEELKPGDIHRIISGQDGTCCLGTYTCEAQNCMGIAASSASLLGFEDTMKAGKISSRNEPEPIQRNISLSTIHEERTSQLYDTPVGDITLDEKGEISFSFSGKEVSVSLYETPDLTEEEALQIVEMYADQLSENITEQNVVELPPLRFVKETSTSGNLLMEAIVIDVSPDYFISAEDDLRTEADMEDISIIEDGGIPTFPVEITEVPVLHHTVEELPARPPRKKSESIRSADDYYSLTKEKSESGKHLVSDGISESDQQSFKTADSLDINKVSVNKIDALEEKRKALDEKSPKHKKKRKERRESTGSRKSSSGSEISLDADMVNLSPKIIDEISKRLNTLFKISKVVQSQLNAIEDEVILQSAQMSCAATAKKSLEVIDSVKIPLKDIQTVSNVIRDNISKGENLIPVFQTYSAPLKILHQNLAIIEKCVEIESSGKTLVQRTSICLVETLGKPMQSIFSILRDVCRTLQSHYSSKNMKEIYIVLDDTINGLLISEESIKSVNLIREAAEIPEKNIEDLQRNDMNENVNALQNIWKPILKLQKSLESVKQNICIEQDINMQEYVLELITKPIQELQNALETIEEGAVKESNEKLYDINSVILQGIVDPMIGLRSDLDSLKNEMSIMKVENTLDNIMNSIHNIKSNLISIGEQFNVKDIEPFEDNQKMIQCLARNLLMLQNNIDILALNEKYNDIKEKFDILQNNLAKLLEAALHLSSNESLNILKNITSPAQKLNDSFAYLKANNIDDFVKAATSSIENLKENISQIQVTNIIDVNDCLQSSILSIEDLATSLHQHEVSKSANEDVNSDLKCSINSINDITNKIKTHITMVTEMDQPIESLKDFGKLENISQLTKLVNIFVEIRDKIGSSVVKAEESDEYPNSLTENNVIKELANPLFELNCSLNVSNEQIFDDYESIKTSNNDISALKILIKPLQQFHDNLTVVQQNIQLEAGADIENFMIKSCIAKSLQELDSCLLEIQQQYVMEAADDLSTLEDISGLKSIADIKQSLATPHLKTVNIPLETTKLLMDNKLDAQRKTIQTLYECLSNILESLQMETIENIKESPLKTFVECVIQLKSALETYDILKTDQVDGNLPEYEEIVSSVINLQTLLDGIINEKSCGGAHEEKVDNETLKKIHVITESLLELQQNMKLVNESVSELKGEKAIEKLSSLRENLALKMEPMQYENIEDISATTEISMLKTLAMPLHNLKHAVGAIQQEILQLEKHDEIISEDIMASKQKLNISLQDVLNGIVTVEHVLTDEYINSLSENLLINGSELEQIALPLHNLSEKIIAVQETLLSQPQDMEQSFNDFTYNETFAEALVTVNKCYAVLEQHDLMDTTHVSDLYLKTEAEQFADIKVKLDLFEKNTVLENTLAIFTNIQSLSEISEKIPNANDKLINMQNYIMIIQMMFKKPLAEIINNRNEINIMVMDIQKELNTFEVDLLSSKIENKENISKKYVDCVKSNLKKINDMLTVIFNYNREKEYINPLKNIKQFINLVSSMPLSLSKQIPLLDIMIPPLQEICHQYELSDLNSDTSQHKDIIVNVNTIEDPLNNIMSSIKQILKNKDIEFTQINFHMKDLHNVLEKNVTTANQDSNMKSSFLREVSLPLQNINNLLSNNYSQTSDLPEVNQNVIELLIEPTKKVQNCLDLLQKQLNQSDDDTLTADISLSESYAEPVFEMQKQLANFEECLILNDDLPTESQIENLSQMEKSLNDFQDNVTSIAQICSSPEEMLCIDNLKSSINEMENTIQKIEKAIIVNEEKFGINKDITEQTLIESYELLPELLVALKIAKENTLTKESVELSDPITVAITIVEQLLNEKPDIIDNKNFNETRSNMIHSISSLDKVVYECLDELKHIMPQNDKYTLQHVNIIENIMNNLSESVHVSQVNVSKDSGKLKPIEAKLLELNEIRHEKYLNDTLSYVKHSIIENPRYIAEVTDKFEKVNEILTSTMTNNTNPIVNETITQINEFNEVVVPLQNDIGRMNNNELIKVCTLLVKTALNVSIIEDINEIYDTNTVKNNNILIPENSRASFISASEELNNLCKIKPNIKIVDLRNVQELIANVAEIKNDNAIEIKKLKQFIKHIQYDDSIIIENVNYQSQVIESLQNIITTESSNLLPDISTEDVQNCIIKLSNLSIDKNVIEETREVPKMMSTEFNDQLSMFKESLLDLKSTFVNSHIANIIIQPKDDLSDSSEVLLINSQPVQKLLKDLENVFDNKENGTVNIEMLVLKEVYKDISCINELIINHPQIIDMNKDEFSQTVSLVNELEIVSHQISTICKENNLLLDGSDMSAVELCLNNEISKDINIIENASSAIEDLAILVANSKEYEIITPYKIDSIKNAFIKAKYLYEKPLAEIVSNRQNILYCMTETKLLIDDFESTELVKQIKDEQVMMSLKSSINVIKESISRMSGAIKKLDAYCRQSNYVKPMKIINKFLTSNEKLYQAGDIPPDTLVILKVMKPVSEICTYYEIIDTKNGKNTDYIKVPIDDVKNSLELLNQIFTSFTKMNELLSEETQEISNYINFVLNDKSNKYIDCILIQKFASLLSSLTPLINDTCKKRDIANSRELDGIEKDSENIAEKQVFMYEKVQNMDDKLIQLSILDEKELPNYGTEKIDADGKSTETPDDISIISEKKVTNLKEEEHKIKNIVDISREIDEEKQRFEENNEYCKQKDEHKTKEDTEVRYKQVTENEDLQKEEVDENLILKEDETINMQIIEEKNKHAETKNYNLRNKGKEDYDKTDKLQEEKKVKERQYEETQMTIEALAIKNQEVEKQVQHETEAMKMQEEENCEIIIADTKKNEDDDKSKSKQESGFMKKKESESEMKQLEEEQNICAKEERELEKNYGYQKSAQEVKEERDTKKNENKDDVEIQEIQNAKEDKQKQVDEPLQKQEADEKQKQNEKEKEKKLEAQSMNDEYEKTKIKQEAEANKNQDEDENKKGEAEVNKKQGKEETNKTNVSEAIKMKDSEEAKIKQEAEVKKNQDEEEKKKQQGDKKKKQEEELKAMITQEEVENNKKAEVKENQEEKEKKQKEAEAEKKPDEEAEAEKKQEREKKERKDEADVKKEQEEEEKNVEGEAKRKQKIEDENLLQEEEANKKQIIDEIKVKGKQDDEAKKKEDNGAKKQKEEAKEKYIEEPDVEKKQEEDENEIKEEFQVEKVQEEDEMKKKEEAEAMKKQEEEAKQKDDAEAKKNQKEEERKKKEEAEDKIKLDEEAKKKEEAEEKKKQDKEAKKKEEAEAKKKQDEESKKTQEVEAKEKQEEEEKKKKEEAESKKIQDEEAEAKKKQDEEAKKKEEADANAKQDEAKLKEEAEAKKKQDEEAEAKAKQDEAKKKEKEERKKKEDSEAKKNQDEEVKKKEEAEAKAKQDEAKKKAEEERKKKEEAEAKKNQDEEVKKKEEAEAKAKQDEAKKKAEEERKNKDETEAKKKQEEEEKKKKEEAEAKKKQDEEAKKKQEVEAKMKLEEEEKKKKEEAEAKKKQDEEAKKKEEAETKAKQDEAKKKEEEERKMLEVAEAKKKQEEEERKKKEEAEAKKKQDEEAKTKQEAEAMKKLEEEEKKKKEEAEAKRKQDEEAKKKEEVEAKAKQDEAKKKEEEERKNKKEAEAKMKQEEEEKKKNEEAEAKKKQDEEAKKKEEAEAKAKQDEAKSKEEEERKNKEEAEAKKKQEEEEKKKKEEAEAKKKQDEEAKTKQEAEAMKKLEEEEKKKKEEAEAKRKQDEEAKKKEEVEAKAKQDEAKKKEEEERKNKEEAEAKKKKEEEEKKKKEEAEAKRKQDEEAKKKEEAEAKAKQDEAKKKEEEERKNKEEAEAKKKQEEEEKKKKEEAEAKRKQDEEAKKKEEAEAKAKQDEAKKKEEEERKNKEEAEAKKKQEEEEKKKKEEAEAKRKQDEEAKKKEEAEAKAKQDEAKKKEEEERKNKEEAEAKKKQEEEEKKKREEAEAKKKQDEEAKTKQEAEAKKKLEEEEKKKREVAEAKKKQDEKAKKKEEVEAKAKQDEAKKKEEEEIKMKEVAEVKKKQKEEEKKKREEAEAKKNQDEALKKQEEERNKKDEAEAKKMQEEKKKKQEAEAKKKQDEEAKKKEEAEAKAKQDEAKKKEEEERKNKEEAEAKKKKEEEEKKKKEEAEAKRKQDEEAKKKEEAEAKAKQDEAKKKEEEERKNKEEAEAKKKQEEEEKKKKEEAEAKRKQDEEAKKKEEAEAKAKQDEAKKKEEEERKNKEEAEAKKKQEEEDKKKKEAAETKKKQDEEAKTKQEVEAKAKQDEAKKKEEEERKIKDVAEAKKKQEEEEKKKREEAEAKKNQDEALKKQEEERNKKDEAEAKKMQEEKKKKQEAEAKKKQDEEAKKKEEAEAKAKQDEAKKKEEEERKNKEEAEAKKKQEEEEKKKKEAAEAKKKQAEEAKTKQEVEAKAKQNEAKKKEDEERKIKDVAEAKKKQEEEEKKKREEAEAKKNQDEAIKKQEEERNKKDEAEAKKIQEEKKKKQEAEAEAKKKQDDEAQKKGEADAKKKQDEEAKKKEEAEAKAKQDEAKKKEEAEVKSKQEEEAKKKEEVEEKAKQDEAKKKEEEERKKTELAEAKKKEEEERKRREVAEAKKKQAKELKKKQEEEEKKKQEEEEKKKQEEEEKKKKEEDEAKKKQDEEAKKKEEAETKIKQDEEAKNKEERKKKEVAVAKKKQEEEEKKKKEETEAKKKQDEEAKKKEEAEAKKKKEEDEMKKKEEALIKKKQEEEEKKKKEEAEAKKKQEEDGKKKKKEEAVIQKKPVEEAKKNEEEQMKKIVEKEKIEKAETKKKLDEATKKKQEDETKKNNEEDAKIRQKEVAKSIGDVDFKKKEMVVGENKCDIIDSNYGSFENNNIKILKDGQEKIDIENYSGRDKNKDISDLRKKRDISHPSEDFNMKKDIQVENSDRFSKHYDFSPASKNDQTLYDDYSSKINDLKKNDYAKRSERYIKTTSEFSEYSSIPKQKAPGPRDSKKKPMFSTRLTDRSAVEGSRVKLTCSVLGTPDPNVQWFRNGVLLTDKNKYLIKYIDGLATLEVLNAEPRDSADYTCTATNENGTASCSATLKVYVGVETTPIPPTFTRSIKDTYHVADDEMILECRIRGNPRPVITWMKDGIKLGSESRYQMNYLADGVCRLVINRPSPSDSGKYICKAENPLWSDEISHHVQFAGRDLHLAASPHRFETVRSVRSGHESRRPYFSRVLADHAVPIGGTIALQVEIGGNSTEVEWRRGGVPLPKSTKVKQYVDKGVHILALENASIEESGIYTCTVKNEHGSVDTTATVSVLPPGTMRMGKAAFLASRPESDMSVTEGEDFSISLRAQGDPKPKVIWMKGLRDITNSWRSLKENSDDYFRFTLKRTLMSDAGTYCVLAKNCYGTDRAFVTLYVRQRLDGESFEHDKSELSNYSDSVYLKDVPQAIVGQPEVADGGKDWVSLRWPKPPRGPQAPVLAYRVDAWLQGTQGGARWQSLGLTPVNGFDAFQLTPGAYLFRVTPRNRYGWGPSIQTSEPISVGSTIRLPEFQSTLPGQVKVLAGDSITLSCTVIGSPTPTIVWYKDGQEIDGAVMSTGGRCVLHIGNVEQHHEGRYTCEATGPEGRAATFARLCVVTDKKIYEADENFKRYIESDSMECAPVFSMRLRDRRVQATYPVRLTCRVEGRPAPLVTWTKDDEVIEQNDHFSFWVSERFHTLEISSTTLDDAGKYSAHAANPLGAVRCSAILTVDKGLRAYLAPDFVLAPDTLYRVFEGSELRIRAAVEAYPSVGVSWHRDGLRLRPSRRTLFTLDRDGELEMALAYVTKRDSGIYTVTASNEVGKATCSTRVEVISPGEEDSYKDDKPLLFTPSMPYSKEPIFIKKPRSSEAREGDTVVILCEVTGDPKPEVLWLRDWLKPEYYRDDTQFRRIGAGPEYRLEIPHCKLDHTGAYTVIASNCHGQTKAIISLQIYAKGPDEMDHGTITTGRVHVLPKVIRELKDLRCCDGDAVTFECLVDGTPRPLVHWEKDGQLIHESEDFRMGTDGEVAHLTIGCVYPEDEGVYTCTAYNELGKAQTSSCLIVDVPEEKENLLSQQLTRPPMLLSAGSTPRSTPCRSMSPQPHHRVSRPRDSLSQTPSRTSRWKLAPPKFFAVPFNRVAEEGENVSFRCSIAGHPIPKVYWDKDGSEIQLNPRISIREKDDDRILTINSVKYEDSGIYRVTLENEAGRVEATACLDVINLKGHSPSLRVTENPRASPYVRRHLNGSHYRVGERLRLSGEIRGSSSKISKWYRNGLLLEMNDRVFELNRDDIFSLIIDPLEASDSGVYTLVVSDEIGVASSWTRVYVENKIINGEIKCIKEHQPHIIKHLKDNIQVVEGKATEILLVIENCCVFTFTWIRNNTVLPDSDIYKYVDYGNGIIGLRFEDIYMQDEGVFTCIVRNNFGSAKSTCNLHVKESKTGIGFNGFKNYPESVLVQDGDDAVFHLRVNSECKSTDRKAVWQVGGKEITGNTERFKLSVCDSKFILRINKVKGSDSGYVRCALRIPVTINDEIEESESVWFTTNLTVVPKAYMTEMKASDIQDMKMEMKPRFISKIDNVITQLGGKALFNAQFYGYPTPQVSWLMLDREILPCKRFNINNTSTQTTLEITDAELSDSAVYKVVIENEQGINSISALLQVQDTEKPLKPAPLYHMDDGMLFDSHYSIHNVIGRGHFGSVKLIKNKKSGEQLAAKFVKISKQKDKDMILSELEILHCLKHPKLIQLVDAFMKPNQMIIVTEYVSGGQLFERVSEDDFTLTERDCKIFMTQILEGVAFMHSKNIVHLDLKPENIMCHTRPSCEIKIIDFGLAKRLHPNEEIRTLCGTAEFIAPEVVNFDPISTASDMWSVGVICYILLSGLSPFAGDTVQETYSNILRVKYDFEDEAFDKISEEAKDFIRDLLVKPMDKRSSAVKCLQNKWMIQHQEADNTTALSTEKLRKFVIQSKWQMTGNAIRAVGRMASLCAISRMNTSRMPNKSDNTMKIPITENNTNP